MVPSQLQNAARDTPVTSPARPTRFTQDISTQLLVPKTKEEVIDLVPQLLVYLNETFPRHCDIKPINASTPNLEDGIAHATAFFDALESVLTCVESPYLAIPKHQSNNLAQFVISGLAGFDLILSTVNYDSGDEKITVLKALQDRAYRILVGMLQRFSNSGSVANRTGWHGLRSLLQDMCSCIRGLMQPLSSLSFPCTPGLFEGGQRPPQPILETNSFPFFASGGASLTCCTDVLRFVTTLLRLCSETLSSNPSALPYLQGIDRLAEQCGYLIIDYCLSSQDCAVSMDRRISSAMEVYTIACQLSHHCTQSQHPGHFAYRILQSRLRSSEDIDWDKTDKIMAQTFLLPDAVPLAHEDLVGILDLLQAGQWATTSASCQLVIANFLRLCIRHSHPSTLARVAILIQGLELGDQTGLVQEALQRRQIEATSSQSSEGNTQQNEGSSQLASQLWEQGVKSAVSSIIGRDVDWMDDNSPAGKYSLRAVQDILAYLHKDLGSENADRQCAVLESLNKFICLVSHGHQKLCTRAKSIRLTIPCPAVGALLDRADTVSNRVKRKVFMVIAQCLRHYPVQGPIEQVEDIIICGLKDIDRVTRTQAGTAFKNLIELHTISGGRSFVYDLLGQRLYAIMNTSPPPVQQSLLLTVASVARDAVESVLGLCVQFLFAYLCSRNPVVRSVSFTQLLGIFKHLGKSGLAVLSPYFRQLVPFAVSRLFSHPSLLTDLCLLIGMPPSGLLKLTAKETLPVLIQQRNLKVIENVASHIDDQDSSHLGATLFKYMSHILASMLLISDPVAYTNTEQFLLGILCRGSTGSNIKMETLVKACQVSLIADMLLEMGDEDPERANLANIALRRVQGFLSPQSKGKKQGTQSEAGTLVHLIERQMLGVVTSFNEVLYETKGRESTDSKRKVLRALGHLSRTMGKKMNMVQSQVMAAFQNTIIDPQLSEIALESWQSFLSVLEPKDLGPHLSAITASFVQAWPNLSSTAKESAKGTLLLLLKEPSEDLQPYLKYVADFESIPLPPAVEHVLGSAQKDWTPRDQVKRLIANISSKNIVVSVQGLTELRLYLVRQADKTIRQFLTGDLFDPLIGQLVGTLLSIACRDPEGSDKLHPLAFECISILGAVDPDKCDVPRSDDHFRVTMNYEDIKECREFAAHLIASLLAGAYKSTSDTRYQTYLAFTIQELCKFCSFKQASMEASNTIPLHARNLWKSLPADVTQTVTPLLEGRYTATLSTKPPPEGRIYPDRSTYREWIQIWVSYLITRVTGDHATAIFGCFQSAISYKDAIVAHHLLPHLILHVLLSGTEDDVQNIRLELVTIILDQINESSDSSADKRRLSAQAVFNAFDHLSRWVRFKRQSLARVKDNRVRKVDEKQLSRVDSILSSVEPSVMAKAALECKAYARALMNYEKHILALQEQSVPLESLTVYYGQLHQIYSNLDEPDGMEGVSTLILSPSLEHQIRQHESSGKWTSAQSCWEVRIQESPENVDFHLGLLRCLRNLGHHDTLRTHVAGLLQRNPHWAPALSSFQVESAWLIGAWDDVQQIVHKTDLNTPPINMAKILLALRSGNKDTIDETVKQARCLLGAELALGGARGYRQTYDIVLNLHLTYELERIGHAYLTLGASKSLSQSRRKVDNLSRALSARLEFLPPAFRIREQVLSLRRTALTMLKSTQPTFTEAIGTSWLTSAKLARKAGQWQTAYSAVLQAQRHGAVWSFIQHAKLIKCTGEPVRALTELTNSMKFRGLLSTNNSTIVDRGNDILEIIEDSEETQRLKAKSACLRGRWMNEQARYESSQAMSVLTEVQNIAPRWEGGFYHLGQFHDQCYKELSASEKDKRGLRMCVHTVGAFGRAAKYGSKYAFQTIPRMLTLWLDIGENPEVRKNKDFNKDFEKISNHMAKFIEEIPPFKWYIAFPQIASRVGHSNDEVYQLIQRLIIRVLQEYPKQAIWGFISTTKSSDNVRNKRGNEILKKLAGDPQNTRHQVKTLIKHAIEFTSVLIELSDHTFDESKGKKMKFSLKEDFPKLLKFRNSPLLIPLQESLTVTLPPTSAIDSTYQPFPIDPPTIEDYADEIELMRSLARPRKICIKGSDGLPYVFLGKPKDDLRKDARLMDLFAMINKFFKANSDSRRRQLHIRTYGVVTMNEQCGFIQWVPNTTCLRPVLSAAYTARGIKPLYEDLMPLWKQVKEMDTKEVAKVFKDKVLSRYPSVLHEWFIESFPEPSEWLTSRLTFGRTAAVMSMIGFILGLGDRHCENILLDENTGDVVHVDFSCLFEKGKALETPERVPFRLTHNMVDGLGVTGVEGVFSTACEITLKILRENRDSLMSVLDAFIHDPLVEWADERRRLELTRRNQVKSTTNLRALAQNSLGPIEKKLRGVYSTGPAKPEKELSEGHLVQTLINEATDLGNLGKMYYGWAAWY